MTQFSANLGFLFTDLDLPEAIRRAAELGFSAVECHWPYDTPAETVVEALQETGLQMLGLNTRRGDVDNGDNGLAAVVGREQEARQYIEESVNYAAATGTRCVHVMAGFANGDDAHATFVENLRFASELAADNGVTILIEPLNHYDAPGYFLSTTSQAIKILDEVDRGNVKLMFDCYHVQIMEGDVSRRLTRLLPRVGHIQFASIPDRGTPDQGELNYSHVFAHLQSLGYSEPLGAEYKPVGNTVDSLQWMQQLS